MLPGRPLTLFYGCCNCAAVAVKDALTVSTLEIAQGAGAVVEPEHVLLEVVVKEAAMVVVKYGLWLPGPRQSLPYVVLDQVIGGVAPNAEHDEGMDREDEKYELLPKDITSELEWAESHGRECCRRLEAMVELWKRR